MHDTFELSSSPKQADSNENSCNINVVKKISFIYIDCNVYSVVEKVLTEMNNLISSGGVIAFDEARNKFNTDEGRAMIKFYKKNKKNYRLVKLNSNYQPDAILIKK